MLRSPLRVLMITHHRRMKAYARPHAMARHLVNRGHKVTLIVTADRRKSGVVESQWDSVRIVETPDLLWGRLRSGWDLWCLIMRIRYLSREKRAYDIVHCFETRPATIYPALLYCAKHNLPMVTDWNDWWGRGGIIEDVRPRWYRILFGPIETYYEEAFRSRGAGLTVISTALAQRAIGLGVSAEWILNLPGGASTELFQARSKEECRRHVGLDSSSPVLGFSSLDSHLDMELVMKALKIVANKYPSVRLVVTGNAGMRIMDLAKAHHVADHVLLTGMLSMEELPWWLGCADLFLLPLADRIYNVGRWPNKIGDYMSLARPTIANPVGDIRALFENEDIGLLAEWEPMDFSSKIIYLLENPQLASELGENARGVALRKFDWRILSGELESFYYRVLNTENGQVS